MEDTKIIPQWIVDMLQKLHAERDRLKAIVEEREAAHEAARRACVKPQQMLAKINDAIQALGQAAEWSNGTGWEVPF